MAQNKNALTRYKVLDQCFRNHGRRYFIEDLICECEKVLLEIDSDSDGVSRRQIFKDIAFMESNEGWSIELLKEREGKRIFYRYFDPGFSINNMPLNEIEINQLQSAINILSQFKGMPQFEWIKELLPKLKQGMSSTTESKQIIEFDNNDYLKGIDNLGQLYNAIFYQKVLEIDYQPYESEISFRLIIHPYYLKQYNNRWFLFGLNQELKKSDWNIALDRIVNIKETSTKYKINRLIKWEEYFDDIIGVTRPEGQTLQNVVLHFYGKTGKYMETKPLHGSQKSQWLDKNTLEVRLNLFLNYEFERLVLSYGDSIKVISPKFLAIHIRKRMEIGLSRY